MTRVKILQNTLHNPCTQQRRNKDIGIGNHIDTLYDILCHLDIQLLEEPPRGRTLIPEIVPLPLPLDLLHQYLSPVIFGRQHSGVQLIQLPSLGNVHPVSSRQQMLEIDHFDKCLNL